MNKLSKEKQIQLALLIIVTLGVLGALWYFLISFQQTKLVAISKKISAAKEEIDKVQKVKNQSAQIEVELTGASAKLDTIESEMASGDIYAWLNGNIKRFNVSSYNVIIPQIGSPAVGDMPLLPGFPYRQATVAVVGTAYYSDLGKFIADFENHFQYARIQNVSLQPGGGASPDEKEKLSFKMEIVTLIKSDTSL